MTQIRVIMHFRFHGLRYPQQLYSTITLFPMTEYLTYIHPSALGWKGKIPKRGPSKPQQKPDPEKVVKISRNIDIQIFTFDPETDLPPPAWH